MVQLGIIFKRDKHPSLKLLAELSTNDSCFVDEILSLDEAMTRRWDEDAHFILYRLEADMDGKEYTYARVSKHGSLPSELVKAGGRVAVNYLAFDIDLPNHREWEGPDEIESIRDLLALHVEQGSIPEPTVWYTTLHGHRVVYQLTRPVSPSECEALTAILIVRFRKLGYLADPKCADWPRLFRLPYAKREDSGAIYEAEVLIGGSGLDPDDFDLASALTLPMAEGTASTIRTNVPLPDEDDPEVVEQGKAALKIIKTCLRGHDAHDIIFDNKPLPIEGGRNNGLNAFIGKVVGYTASTDITPEGIWHAVLPVIDQIPQHPEPHDWRALGWRMVQRYYGQEIAKISAKQQERAEQQARAEEVAERLPCKHGLPHIVGSGGSFYILENEQSYHPHPVKLSEIVPKVKEFGMEHIIEITESRGRGVVYRKPSDIVNDYATIVTRVNHSSLVDMPSLARVGSETTLTVPIHQHNPYVQAKRNVAVEQWLQALAGDRYGRLIEWLSWYPDRTSPICALNLTGAPGSGKGMLLQGLQEVWRSEKRNDGRVLGKFSAGILESPLVACDESVPSGKTEESGGASETFRNFVAGGEITVRAMRQDAMTAVCYPRVVVTANSEKFLASLVEDEELTQDDMMAIAQRILTIHALDAGREHLEQKGNWEHTAGWAKGRVPSKYVIAGHIMYLYDNRDLLMPAHLDKPRNTGRFAVLGDVDEHYEQLRAIRRVSNHVQYVMERTIRLIELGRMTPSYHENEAGEVLVKSNSYTESMRNGRMAWSQRAVTSALSEIATSVTRLVGDQRGRWWSLDLDLLVKYADVVGVPAIRLRQKAQISGGRK